jgi:hypothetical protein
MKEGACLGETGPAGRLRESGSGLPQSKAADWLEGFGAGLFGEAGRRTPCARRAAILAVVQSLRLFVRREGELRRGASTESWGPKECWERGRVTCGCGGGVPRAWLRAGVRCPVETRAST